MDSGTYIYDESIRPIERIEFNILGNDEIVRISALKSEPNGIEIPDLYDNMEPKRGGLVDTRMGPVDSYLDCATCGLNSTFCVGHFGHINLAVPVFHMEYITFVQKILSSVCLGCSKLLVYKNDDELLELVKNKSGKARFSEIRNITKKVSYCMKPGYGCGRPVSKIKIEIKKGTGAINMISENSISGQPDEAIDGKKKIKQILTPEMVYDILRNISDVDCSIMGLDPKKSRPENMIHLVFPVPPVAVRPSSKVDYLASSTMEDGLTHKLADIIKNNVKIRKEKENSADGQSKYSQDFIHLMQYHIATYLNNETLTIPKSEQHGKTSKSLTSRLKGKEGRIRGNLMGKRVDFSARTVITPDPTIDINEMGIPKKIAMTLTFPEVVTPHNVERLEKLVRNGRDVYPGANFVFPASHLESGRRALPIDLRFRKEKVELRFGDVVERHLQSGDYVLLNRQPTLHKLSMMGHKIKVIDNDDLSTFRLSPNVTTPYNADFDGDKMSSRKQRGANTGARTLY